VGRGVLGISAQRLFPTPHDYLPAGPVSDFHIAGWGGEFFEQQPVGELDNFVVFRTPVPIQFPVYSDAGGSRLAPRVAKVLFDGPFGSA